MLVAKKLRRQNVTAYVVYMFQVEDIIRAYNLDVDRIAAEYLPRFGYDADQMKEAVEWYAGLARMMREEGCTETGHVQVVRNTILLLADRHQELLRDPKQPFYSAAYYKALPSIVELRAHGADREKGEIENCLDAIYGAAVLRMQGRELSAETQTALQPITHLLEMLAQLYNEQDTNS
ncbi:MAG: DUF4924 family protein [Bacteroidaceae bacterium]|nr:DUF4924 family protein [Bacteroidaceae bacterium]